MASFPRSLTATLAVAVISGLLAVSQSAAQPAERPLAEQGRVAMEEIRLKDDTVFRGLIESENARHVVFVEVQRPAGRPAYLVVRPIEISLIAERKRLSAAERAPAIRLVDALRNRVRIEAGRMEEVELAVRREAGRVSYRYTGEHFSLASTADDESTRRAVVRLEQVFLAYRRILPPRLAPKSPLSISLFGSRAEYDEHLARAGLRFANPAYYDVQANRIAAGADLVVYGQQLAKSRAENDAVRRQFDEAAAGLPKKLAELNRELEAQGIPEPERLQEIRAWRTRFRSQREASKRELRAIERANTTKFNEFAGQLLAQLYHEAFHAYVENYLLRHDDRQRRLPRWLNEGLAQVFESGLLEADTLRLDAPSAKALAALQADLRGENPMRLAELLAAGERPFVAAHEEAARSSARHYLYSWGLAYYLALGPTRLDLKKLDQLAVGEEGSAEAIERLLGAPLDRIEGQWRETMLGL